MIQVIGPRLHHPATFGKVLGIVVDRPDPIPLTVRKLALDGIAAPSELIEQRGSHAPKPVRRHIGGPIPQPTQCCVQRVVTHWAIGGALTRKEEEIRARQWLQLSQQRHCLRGQRYDVRLPRLHLVRRDPPLTLQEIEIFPGRVAEFAWADKDQRCKPQRELRDESPVVAIDGSQKRTHLFRVFDGSEMLDLPRRKSTTQLTEDVRLRSPGNDRVPQRLTAVAQNPSRGLVGVLLLQPPQALQNAHGRDLSDRYFADPREDISLQAAEDPIVVRRRPIPRECRIPLSGDDLERILLPREPLLGQPALGGRINPDGELCPQFRTALPRCFQRDGGKRPYREALLPSAEAVLDALPFAAARRDLQIQAVAVEQFVGLFAGLSIEQRVMRERHIRALGTASELEGESMLPGALSCGELPRAVTPRADSLRGSGIAIVRPTSSNSLESASSVLVRFPEQRRARRKKRLQISGLQRGGKGGTRTLDPGIMSAKTASINVDAYQ